MASRGILELVTTGSSSTARFLLVCVAFALVVCTVITVGATAADAALSPPIPLTPKAAEAQIDLALSEDSSDLASVEQIAEQGIAVAKAASPDYLQSLLYQKAAILKVLVLLRTGNFDEARKLVDGLTDLVSLKRSPDTYVRQRSLQAALMRHQGQLAESVAAYEKLLAQDLSSADPLRVVFARGNYADLIEETGEVLKSIDLLEEYTQEGIANNNHRQALAIGRRLIASLLLYERYDNAGYWLEQLRPFIDPTAADLPSQSLLFLKLEWLQKTGASQEAVTGLNAFLQMQPRPPARLLGRARTILAEALMDLGQPQRALPIATLGLQEVLPWDILATEASITLAYVYFELGDYSQASEVLATVLPIDEAVPRRKADVIELRLKIMFESGDFSGALALLPELRRVNAEITRLGVNEQDKYYESKLESARQQVELKTLAARERISESFAESTAARAQEAERLSRQIFWGVVIALLFVLLFGYLEMDRITERRLRLREQAQQQELTQRVVETSQELVVQQRNETELKQALEIKQRAETVGFLVGKVAHDFNNLLQVVSASNELIREDQLSPQGRIARTQSSEALESSARTIRQLLAYSRTSGKKSEQVELATFLSETSALLQSAVGEQGDLQIDASPPGIRVNVDPVQLATFLLDTLYTGTELATTAARVGIQVETFEVPLISAAPASNRDVWSALAMGRYLLLEIRFDLSSAVDSEDAPAASRNAAPNDGEAGKTRRGLAAAAERFARLHQGGACVDSEAGNQFSVFIALPAQIENPAIAGLSGAAPSNAATASVAEESALGGRRILLVEDNDIVATAVAEMLKAAEVETTYVQSADQALAVLNADASNFDDVLSDIRMPGDLDGLGLRDWIREHHPRLRVFLMSGFVENMSDSHSVLRKPFTRHELLEFLAQGLPVVKR